MDTAALGRRLPHRQRHVDLFGGEAGGDRHILELSLAGSQRVGDAVLEAVDGWAFDLALLGGHGAKCLQHLGHAALLTESSDAHGLDGRLIGGRGDLGQK